MKIKNITMVNFMNHVDEIRVKKLPTVLSFALKCNADELAKLVPAYREAHTKAEKEGAEAMRELITKEINVNIQTVKKDVFEKMDADSRFDILSGFELEILDFMIEQ